MAVETPQMNTSVLLNNFWTRVFRGLWIVFTILVLIVVVAGTIAIYQDSNIMCVEGDCLGKSVITDTSAAFQLFGVPHQVAAVLITTLTTFTIAVYILAASFIIYRRPTERIVIITAFTLVSFLVGGPITVSLQPDSLALNIALNIGEAIRVMSLLAFMLTFPNGRFVPTWTGWLFLLIIPIAIASFLASFFYSINVSSFIDGISLFIGISIQIYRYFNVSKITERQQTKWITGTVLLLGLMLILFLIVIQALQSESLSLLALQLFGNVAILLLPFSILAAIQKYGLWDIDFFINRGIVYTLLTTVLSFVFVAIFLALQAAFEFILAGEQLGLELIVPSLAVAGLLNPTRTRIQHFIDRRFYSIQMDYTRIMETPQMRISDAFSATHIGDYRITNLLGSGGMGEVYAGHDKAGRRVAIKVLHNKYEKNAELEERFHREGRAMAYLEHPNIVKNLHFGEDKGRLFIVMEHLEGQDWNAIIAAKGALRLQQILPRLQEVAAALDYVHQNGIFHRDIKPSNVMIENKTNRAIIMDFGIAKIATQLTELTSTGQIVGSLEYIAPEQIQGYKNLDHRADIYSFAVMTYQLLTGELPFDKGNAGALVMAHLLQPPPDASRVKADIPDTVSDAIMRAMAKHPEDRFETVSDFVRALAVL